MFSVIQVNRIYLIFNLVHFLVDSSELISVITVKMEQDIFEVEYSYHRNKPAEWITEMFHDEYYLPYNDINSHNYQ